MGLRSSFLRFLAATLSPLELAPEACAALLSCVSPFILSKTVAHKKVTMADGLLCFGRDYATGKQLSTVQRHWYCCSRYVTKGRSSEAILV